MSTILFRLRGKSDKDIKIMMRLSINRKNVFEVNSGSKINPKDWSTKKNFPIQSTADNKTIGSDLKKLEVFILDELEKDTKKGKNINRDWLQEKTDECVKIIWLQKNPDEHWEENKPKDEEQESREFLINHIQKYIELAPTKEVKGKSALGLAPNTIKKYKTFLNMMIRYEKVIKKQIRFTDIDKYFIESFKSWLLKTENYAMNYAGKQIDHIKTICKDALEYEIPVNKYSTNIRTFKEENDDRYIVTFSFDEIEIIRNTKMPTLSLENAKNWMLIGFEIGQRGGDLLAIDLVNITKRDEKGRIFLSIHQKKTCKWVSVVIHNKNTINIIDNNFPYPISIQKLNEYIKEVASICGFVQMTKGKKFNAELMRKELGTYPKHELTTSHSFRRSFATNWYQIIETSIIMNITGHSRESQFKDYINEREDKEKDAINFADKVEIALEQMQLQNQLKSA